MGVVLLVDKHCHGACCCSALGVDLGACSAVTQRSLSACVDLVNTKAIHRLHIFQPEIYNIC